MTTDEIEAKLTPLNPALCRPDNHSGLSNKDALRSRLLTTLETPTTTIQRGQTNRLIEIRRMSLITLASSFNGFPAICVAARADISQRVPPFKFEWQTREDVGSMSSEHLRGVTVHLPENDYLH